MSVNLDIQALTTALLDDNWVESKRQLIQMGRPALGLLLQLLDMPNRLIRERAALTLAEIAPLDGIHLREAVDSLVIILKDDDIDKVREAAAIALNRMTDSRSMEALSAALLTDGAYGVRLRAALALGQYQHDRSIHALTRAFADTHLGVRRGVILSLKQFDDPRAIPTLVAALADEDHDLAVEAALTLATRYHDARAVDILVREVSDTPSGRMNAIRALMQIQDPRAVEALAFALQHADDDLRLTLILTLGHNGGRDTVSALLPLLADERESVRSFTIRALRSIAERESVADMIVDPLITLAEKDSHEQVRRVAVTALAEIGDAGAIRALMRLLPQATGALRRDIVAVLGPAALRVNSFESHDNNGTVAS